jgi:hypothetical protein
MDYVLAVTTSSYRVVGIHRTKESAEIQREGHQRATGVSCHIVTWMIRDDVKLKEELGDVYARTEER